MPRPPSPSGLSHSAIQPMNSGVFAGLLADLNIRPDEFWTDLLRCPPPELALLLAWPLFAWALAWVHPIGGLEAILAWFVLPLLAIAANLSDRWTQATLVVGLGLPGPLLLLL